MKNAEYIQRAAATLAEQSFSAEHIAELLQALCDNARMEGKLEGVAEAGASILTQLALRKAQL